MTFLIVHILTIIKRDLGDRVRIVPTRLRFYAVTTGFASNSVKVLAEIKVARQ